MERKNATFVMAHFYVSHTNIISALGFTSDAVAHAIFQGKSGLFEIRDASLLPEPFCASIISSEKIAAEFNKVATSKNFTKLEQTMILSLKEVIEASNIELTERVGLIISTTKGNIDVLDTNSKFPENRVNLGELGITLQRFFGFKNEAIVLSNACVSGILAVSVAKAFISEKKYAHVFIVSGDLVSKFVLSGFHSFQALSATPCKPYDFNRNGINLGEVAASVLVTSEEKNLPKIAVEILGDATCNDANHISGPSRTGEGLFRCVTSALNEANMLASEIDYISAHGTATPFNDEMEAVAFNRLGLEEVPLNSLKGYLGHTLGASGLLETILGMYSLQENTLFASKGFEKIGVSKPINVLSETIKKPLRTFLKTASGFGGCNTALVLRKL